MRSEEHTSELQSHSFISYAVFCLKKKKKATTQSKQPQLEIELHNSVLSVVRSACVCVDVLAWPDRLVVVVLFCFFFFFFNDPAPPEISPLPLPAALPISSTAAPATHAAPAGTASHGGRMSAAADI